MKNKYKKIALGILLSLQTTQVMALGPVPTLITSLVASGSAWATCRASKDGFWSAFGTGVYGCIATVIAGGISHAVMMSEEEYSQWVKELREDRRKGAKDFLESLAVSLQKKPLWGFLSEDDAVSQDEMVSFAMESFLYEEYPLIACIEKFREVKKCLEADLILVREKILILEDSEDGFEKHLVTPISLENLMKKIDRYVLQIKTSAEYQTQFSVYQSGENVERIERASYVRSFLLYAFAVGFFRTLSN